MRFYKVTFEPQPGRPQTRWYGTREAATRAFRLLCEQHERFNVDKPLMVNVPTDKPSLLEWLNANTEETL